MTSNFLIVSDQYDQNTDIKPFLLKMHQGNWKLFDSGYTTVAEKCQAASSFLNLELIILIISIYLNFLINI